VKDAYGIIAAILTVISFLPYIRDTLRGKTRPHVYSWFLYSIIAILVFAIQLHNNAGPGAYITLIAGLISILLFFLGLRMGTKDITLSDTIVFVLTLGMIGFLVMSDKPFMSVVLACLIDLMAFIPTIRKTWYDPYSETLMLYTTNFVRYIVAIAALTSLTLINALYPVCWLLVNGLFAVVLVMRRRYISVELQ
jgi:hypothetical protein